MKQQLIYWIKEKNNKLLPETLINLTQNCRIISVVPMVYDNIYTNEKRITEAIIIYEDL